MTAETDSYLGDPIPLEPDASPTEKADAKKEDDLFAPVGTGKSTDEPASKIHTFESDSALAKGPDAEKFKRPLHANGQGAIRTRTFHAKLSTSAIEFMDQQINEWIDSHPDIEVKFANSTVGVVEGKRAETHLILTVWY